MGFLFGVTGRIGRGQWWTAALVYLLVAGVTYAIVFVIGYRLQHAASLFALILAAIAVLLVVVVSAISTGVKRLHDRGRSGWWLLLFYVVPGVLGTLADRLHARDAAGGILFVLASLAVSVGGLVALGFLRGTPGPNQFGPEP